MARLTNREYYSVNKMSLSMNVMTYNTGDIQSLVVATVTNMKEVYRKNYSKDEGVSVLTAVSAYNDWLDSPNKILTDEEYKLLSAMVRPLLLNPKLKSINIRKSGDSVTISNYFDDHNLDDYDCNYYLPSSRVLGENYQFDGLEKCHDYSPEDLGLVLVDTNSADDTPSEDDEDDQSEYDKCHGYRPSDRY